MNERTISIIEDILSIFIQMIDIGSSNAKKAIIESNRNNFLFIETLKFYLDDKVTGIKDKKFKKNCRDSATNEIQNFEELFRYLRTNNSGRDEDVGTVQNFIDNFSGRYSELLFQLVIKNIEGLNIGITLVNSALGYELIQDFEVMLAENYFDDPEYWNGREICIQTKLDGKRTIVIKKNGKVKVYARSGKDLTGQFPEIEEDVRKIPFDYFVLDGELMPIGFPDLTSNQAWKKVTDNFVKGEKRGYCIAVYDYLNVLEWENKECETIYEERYNKYRKLLCNSSGEHLYKHLHPLEYQYMGPSSSKAIIELLEVAKSNKQEGIMLKDVNSFYEWKRSRNICKVKSFFDIDVVIEGFEYGKGKNKDKCGSLFFTYKGTKVNVGSGLTDEMRVDIVKDPSKYIGRTAEIVFFEETLNKKTGAISLRFPTLKVFKN